MKNLGEILPQSTLLETRFFTNPSSPHPNRHIFANLPLAICSLPVLLILFHSIPWVSNEATKPIGTELLPAVSKLCCLKGEHCA